MYLKRLELVGFKSFADKTILEFGQGVTTVVGPNGSGKSNISDAIRWVMGEMSAKTLRGSNMQDVIFAGTEIRKPVNYAEVSLVLDNSDKMFPIDYEEVVVTRKVFRSGETVYQINHSDCRLKDIHELFMDTGLGRDGYSMIGQGNVSQILSTKADDRRTFFEEAAGVSKYKHRKDEALRKLVSVNENLVRINDITTELERQLGPLENQSKKARKYMELYDEYKGLDVSMCLINLAKNSELLKEAQKLYDSISGEIEDLKSKETEIEAKRNELYMKSSSLEEEQTRKNNELIDNEGKSMICSNDISIAENDIKNNQAFYDRIDKEIFELEIKSADAKQQIEELTKSIENRKNEKEILMQGFENIQRDNSEIFDLLNSCKEEIERLRTDVIEKMNEISSAKAKISGIENLRSSFLQRREAVENEIKTHGTGIENTKKEIEEAKDIIKVKGEKAETMRTRVDSLNNRITSMDSEFEENKRQISSMQVNLNSKISQKKMLEGMENEYEGFSRAVKAVMTAPQLKKNAVYGTVSGLIEVEKEFVVAIETALGGAMQNIVVESEEDAKAAINFLKQAKSGRATFLPLSSVSGRELENIKDISKCDGYIGVASELITYDKKYYSVMKSLLGRVVVADNMDNAVYIARKFNYRFKIVTTDGELLNPGGSISGGSVNRTSGFLSRSAQIKSLGEEIAKLTVDIKEMSQKNSQIETDMQNIRGQLSNYMPLLREYENDILVAKNTLEHLQSTLENSGSSQNTLEQELEQIETQLSLSADEIAKQISETRTLEKTVEELNNKISEKEEEQEQITNRKEAQSQQLMDETLKLRTIEKDIEAEKNSVSELNNLILENEKLKTDKKSEQERLKTDSKSLEEKISAKNKEIEEIKAFSQKIKGEIERIDKEKTSIVEGLKGITNSNKDLTDRLITLQQELSKAEAKQTKYENDSENIINRLWDEYELTVTSADEIKQEIENTAEAQQRVSELKGKIKALGSVNVDSIEEYVQTKERFDFLSNQKNDLEKSQENLNKIISSMQELMEEHFKTQFEEINKAFSRVFCELFGGGRGKLYLSDPNDVMESGIEIEVQLPGKGLQNINLYSGGEKSFIAIALLFAILEVKPTPFCFLDEIDAALDDVNVSRFATYLKNYMNSTQFIVITHRRGTMEAANIMYGVTMQEKGVSKLLSLKIDDVDDEMLK
ncbi:MAG: chromosome segregation protein SMC [Clostridia bacterium]|nr:chromosome segregation protein SMC [Clostridia bacterium]